MIFINSKLSLNENKHILDTLRDINYKQNYLCLIKAIYFFIYLSENYSDTVKYIMPLITFSDDIYCARFRTNIAKTPVPPNILNYIINNGSDEFEEFEEFEE